MKLRTPIARFLCLALILSMLLTCLATLVSAEGETVINTDPSIVKGIYTLNAGLSGTNLRITGGTFDGVFLGAPSGTYNITDNVAYTFEGGTFQNVYLCSKSAGTISGNITYNVKGGTFENGIKLGNMRDYNLNAGTVKFGNISVIIDGASETLSLEKVFADGRTPQRIDGADGKTTGVWTVIVNNCDDTTIPTLSGNVGNQTTVTAGTGENYIDITQFINGDYRIYVKGGEAQPVFDGTTFKGFTLKSNVDGLVPKVTYNYKRTSDNSDRKGVAYPVANENGIYDLSSCNSGLSTSDNRSNYVTIIEFVPVVEALGASLRYVNDDANYNGIRFGMKFSDGHVTGAGTADANFGVILMAKSNYDSKSAWTLEEMKTSAKARVASGSTCIGKYDASGADTGFWTVNVILYNIPESNYDSDIVAVPYIGDTLYTDCACVRSMYDVASACVADENATAEAKTYCQTIIDAVTNASKGTN